MLRPGSLDELLRGEELHATLHDAFVRRIAVDDQARRDLNAFAYVAGARATFEWG